MQLLDYCSGKDGEITDTILCESSDGKTLKTRSKELRWLIQVENVQCPAKCLCIKICITNIVELNSLFICCITDMVLGRVAGNSTPLGESFHLSPSLTCSLLLLTSHFTGSGLTEDVSFHMYLHMSHWILWSWLASLEILTINKPTCIARTHFFTQLSTFFWEAWAFQHLLHSLLYGQQPENGKYVLHCHQRAK